MGKWRQHWENRWFEYWLPTLKDQLGISFEESAILQEFSEYGLRNTVSQNTVFSVLQEKKSIVFGGGPNLIQHIKMLKRHEDWENEVSIIVADGAAQALLDEGFTPSIVFTDLDGGLDLIDRCLKESSIVFVLLHSDNTHLVREFGIRKAIYCTQIKPMFGFVNTFGFTDGDRAISFSVCSGAKTLCLGFDFRAPPSQFSTRKKQLIDQYLTQKKAKLSAAENIVQELAQSGLVYTLDPARCPGIKVFRIDDFLYNL